MFPVFITSQMMIVIVRGIWGTHGEEDGNVLSYDAL
jgi:hypothetical protein